MHGSGDKANASQNLLPEKIDSLTSSENREADVVNADERVKELSGKQLSNTD